MPAATPDICAMYTTLVSVDQLQLLQKSAAPQMVFDCSFELAHAEAGEQSYLQSHIPGAVYADLDHALSARHGEPALAGTVLAAESDLPASGGRHPLPSRERFAVWLSSVGFTNRMQAVVYDRNGVNFCGRLWWMLKWAGHDAVAVLDGGLQAWQASGAAVSQGTGPTHFQSNFELGTPLCELVTTDAVAAQLANGNQRRAGVLLDARAAARYRGEVEPLDSVAGHIPGALNRPFSSNLAEDGRFKPAAQLRRELEALLAGSPQEQQWAAADGPNGTTTQGGKNQTGQVVHYCGSGASATVNILAMEIAGLGKTALYAGSWSEWCSNPQRPVEKGQQCE